MLAHLVAAGFARAEPPILQPAAVFLDLAGEDIRGRIYLTSDASGAEYCLRPEYTIPVCRQYLAGAHSGRPAELFLSGSCLSLSRGCGRPNSSRRARDLRPSRPRGRRRRGHDLALEAAELAGGKPLSTSASATPACSRASRNARSAARLAPPHPPRPCAGAGASCHRRARRAGIRDRSFGRAGGARRRRPRRARARSCRTAVDRRHLVCRRAIAPRDRRTLPRTGSVQAGAGFSSEKREITRTLSRRLRRSRRQFAKSFARYAADERTGSRGRARRVRRASELPRGARPRHVASRFSAGFARNLDYYTGFVFEGLRSRSHRARPLVGGGRYDRLHAHARRRRRHSRRRRRHLVRPALRRDGRGRELSQPMIQQDASARARRPLEGTPAGERQGVLRPRRPRCRARPRGCARLSRHARRASPASRSPSLGLRNRAATRRRHRAYGDHGRGSRARDDRGADDKVELLTPLGFGHANVVVAVPQAWIDVRTHGGSRRCRGGVPCAARRAHARRHEIRQSDPQLFRAIVASPIIASSKVSARPKARRPPGRQNSSSTSPPPARR